MARISNKQKAARQRNMFKAQVSRVRTRSRTGRTRTLRSRGR